MNMLCLVIGTAAAVSFIVFLKRGEAHAYMLENLSTDDYPLKHIYVAGLAFQDTAIGRLQGRTGSRLRSETTLLYSRKYSEYYARIIWAQAVSFCMLFVSVFFLLAGMTSADMQKFLALVGIALSVFSAGYFLTYTKGKLDARREECETEFPNAISKLALIVNSGMILHEAWSVVAYGKAGTFYELMRKAAEDMENGKSDIDAIHEFGNQTDSDDIKKFTTALIQSIERGGGALPQFLESQSSELWGIRRQRLLQKGEKAAGALLMPIALMFAGVILIVLSAALQSFGL